MTRNLRLYTTAMFELEHVISLVPTSAWDLQSPCAGWSIRDVAGHAMGVTRNIAVRAGGGVPGDAFENPSALAGADPLESFRAIRRSFLVSTDREGALRMPVKSRVGDMSVDSYMGFMRSDTFVHTWDIARGATIDFRFDPQLVSVVLADYRSRDMTPLRVPGRYDQAIPATDRDELDTLIAFTGRDPDWTAPA